MRKTMAASIAAVALLTGGLSTTAAAADGGASGEARQGEEGYSLSADGRFQPVGDGAVPMAVTYDEELVPPGTGITVGQRVEDGRMVIEVDVEDAMPGHTFGTHVHTDPCGADPDAAGGHYQNRPGEELWRANPYNEVWLDFMTGAAGAGGGEAQQEWVFRAGGAQSVVLHEHATETGDGHHGGTPGDAGDRVACFTIPLVGFGGA